MPTPTMIMLREPTSGDRVSRWLAQITLSVIAVAAIFFVVTITYPWDPVSRLELTVVGESRAGNNVIVSIDYCQPRDWTPSEIRWSLMNDVAVVLPVMTASLPIGCHVKRLAVPVPGHVASGRYRLQEELRFQPWPWRSYDYVRQSQEFLLLGKD